MPREEPPIEKLTFEEALLRLEEIVAQLDEGELSLEEALARFQEGSKLREYCEKMLAAAEAQVTELLAANEGGAQNNQGAETESPEANAPETLFGD